MSTRGERSVACLVLLAFATAAQCTDPPPAAKTSGKTGTKSAAPNLEFLEYLGTLESDEENWTDIADVDLAQRQPQRKNGVPKVKSKTETVAKTADSGK